MYLYCQMFSVAHIYSRDWQMWPLIRSATHQTVHGRTTHALNETNKKYFQRYFIEQKLKYVKKMQ